jgi:hypothetical protein
MTPWECAEGITAFIQRQIAEYDEDIRDINPDGTETKTHVQAFTGFLPRARSKEELLKLCPAIVVRPDEVSDEEERTIVRLIMYVTTYDPDMQQGHVSLYHLMEWLRYQLLSHNPVPDADGKERWFIVDGTLKSSVPDDQPFPQWWGYVEADIYLPQPKTNYTLTYDWRRERGEVEKD